MVRHIYKNLFLKGIWKRLFKNLGAKLWCGPKLQMNGHPSGLGAYRGGETQKSIPVPGHAVLYKSSA